MAKILRRTQFGNPILRQVARRLSEDEIKSDDIQRLIANMRHTLVKKKYGVGLAAPQVGESVAISVIGIKPTPTRPNLKNYDMNIINPVITETFGSQTGMWEGCISCGTGNGMLFAKALRYKKVRLQWHDEKAQRHERIFDGFTAHVIQHETDHLNGVLFVDRVRDSKTYMTASEYKKRVATPDSKSKKS
jgi:peptide deformylase